MQRNQRAFRPDSKEDRHTCILYLKQEMVVNFCVNTIQLFFLFLPRDAYAMHMHNPVYAIARCLSLCHKPKRNG